MRMIYITKYKLVREKITLLKEFNDQSRSLGLLLMNRDPSLDHEKWKQECDDAQRELDKLVKTINSL